MSLALYPSRVRSSDLLGGTVHLALRRLNELGLNKREPTSEHFSMLKRWLDRYRDHVVERLAALNCVNLA